MDRRAAGRTVMARRWNQHRTHAGGIPACATRSLERPRHRRSVRAHSPRIQSNHRAASRRQADRASYRSSRGGAATGYRAPRPVFEKIQLQLSVESGCTRTRAFSTALTGFKRRLRYFRSRLLSMRRMITGSRIIRNSSSATTPSPTCHPRLADFEMPIASTIQDAAPKIIHGT